MPDKKDRIPSIRPTDDGPSSSSSRSSKPTAKDGSFRPPQSSAPRVTSRLRPASSAPKKPSFLSKVTSAYPKSSRPSKIPEEDDDEPPPPGSDSDSDDTDDYEDDEVEEDAVDEKPAHKSKTVLPTALHRDKAKSVMPTNLLRDKMKTALPTNLHRDNKSIAPTTQLTRDKKEKNTDSQSIRVDSRREGQASIKPKTVAGGSASIKPKTVVGGGASISPKLIKTDAATIEADEKIMTLTRSVVPTKALSRLATAHSKRPTMTATEKRKHDANVKEENEILEPCPEAYEFNCVQGGYVCAGGGHGMTDEMIEEGMGAICAFEKDELFKWSMKRGPYYKVGKDAWVWNKNRKFDEVLVPRKHGGP